MFKINSVEEKKQYWAPLIGKEGAYFKVKYDNVEEFIYIHKFGNWDEDGDWFLEYPNQLMEYDFTGLHSEPTYYDEEDDEWYDNPFAHMHIEGNKAYEIVSFQTSPFLPESFEIEFVTDSELDAIKYMLENGIK